ncbi:uncharacterized protein LAESUDRAFT_372533 [Laetiporus sulphureus 93-53]|uniref:Uncharacterized protein n=1 Tax=Laetiporus sulphureus 93-53 TaxID=1314785 RepID=A0A165CRG5_9APHY|nr:uncharacterized protein LAESUDRAFT_372533 [Laetiporus sulphureus 93-53]KZT03295.1 hypothetical protein LAESUDRAFT_372533 [Laetiporus sulphureus 93-53]
MSSRRVFLSVPECQTPFRNQGSRGASCGTVPSPMSESHGAADGSMQKSTKFLRGAGGHCVDRRMRWWPPQWAGQAVRGGHARDGRERLVAQGLVRGAPFDPHSAAKSSSPTISDFISWRLADQSGASSARGSAHPIHATVEACVSGRSPRARRPHRMPSPRLPSDS